MSRMYPLSISILSAAGLGLQSAAWREHTLAYVSFTGDSLRDETPGAPLVRVNTPVLGQAEGFLEVWRSAATVAAGQWGAVRYAYNSDSLFGCLVLSESDFAEAAEGEAPSPLQRATQHAFREIFGVLEELNYPNLLRIWSYFPAINEESHGLERYRQFNIGRQEGFVAHGRSLTENIPAACALGTVNGGLTIYFIAGRNKPVAIENPRQVSSYHYPPDYGPRSPTFSRATLGRVGGQEVLFVSGTSSIVGYRSVHVGDVAAQTAETLVNIESVVGEANRNASRARFDLASLSYKVYVRRPEDVGVIKDELLRAVGPRLQAIYLQADICRRDLLVEIEAIAGIPTEIVRA
jgi:chorismate lyase / 3-hydroxybenzoate synthase